MALLQSITSPYGLVVSFPVRLASDRGRFPRHALMRLALRPVSACHIGNLRGLMARLDLRRGSRATGHHSSEFGEEFKRKHLGLPHPDFDAPSGFPNLSAPCSFRCFPSMFQPGCTRGVRTLQRLLLLGCQRCQVLPRGPTSPCEVVCPVECLFGGSTVSSFEEGAPANHPSKGTRLCADCLTASFEVVCPS